MIAYCTKRFGRYSQVFTWDLVPVAFAIPYHRNIPMDKYIHLTFLLLFSVDLVITRYPEILSIDPRISCAYCLAIPCHLNTPMDNSRTCRVSAYPQLFMCFTKVFKIIFDLPKILWSLWLLKFLLACIMVNPISLVVILTFLVITILSLLTQYVCEYTQSSLILINYFSGWAAILFTGIGSRPIQLSLIVPYGYSTYPPLIRALLLIPWFGNHNFFAFDNWVSQLFL